MQSPKLSTSKEIIIRVTINEAEYPSLSGFVRTSDKTSWFILKFTATLGCLGGLLGEKEGKTFQALLYRTLSIQKWVVYLHFNNFEIGKLIITDIIRMHYIIT